MKRRHIIYKLYIVLFTILILTQTISTSINPINAYAHSGRTDSKGGHRDNKNKSGLGSYHYHCGGHPAHLHSGGKCPYTSSASTSDTIIIFGHESCMYVGQSQQITYKTSSGSSYVKMTSSNPDVVSVHGEDTLIAKSIGSSKITITTINSSKDFYINVSAIEVSQISLSEESCILQVGNTKNINVIVYPSSAIDRSIIWDTENEDIAIVDDGTIKAINEGTTTITATSSNGISKSINVETYTVLPELIEVSNDNIIIDLLQNEEIKINIFPQDSNNKSYTVTNSNGDIINFIQDPYGIDIFPIAEGKTEITITTWNGVEKIIPIEVYSTMLESIEIDDSKLPYIFNNYIDINEQNIKLESFLTPSNSTYKDVVWESSDEKILKVSFDGGLDITGAGKAVITCYSSYDNNIVNSITINILDKDKLIALTFTIITVILIIIVIVFLIYGQIKYKKRIK